MIDLSNYMEFLPFFAIALVGALLNDFYQTMSNEEESLKVDRILLSAFTGGLLVFGGSNYLAKYLDSNMFMLISFVAGVTGFKIFENFKNINLVEMFLRAFDMQQIEEITIEETTIEETIETVEIDVEKIEKDEIEVDVKK